MSQNTALPDFGPPPLSFAEPPLLPMPQNMGSYNAFPMQPQMPFSPGYQGQLINNNKLAPSYNYQVERPRYVEYTKTEVVPVIKQVPVPETFNIPVPQPRQVAIEKTVERNIPVPVDGVTSVKYVFPQVVPKYNIIKEKVIVPRYIEVAVPTHMVEVEEFESAMIPGPPMKDFQWPQHAMIDGEQGTQGQKLEN